ncbi:MAG: peptidylprolyl isomerase [Nitrospira sp.]|nr:peptidylprolyl isomerase [Nitrospira sp.]
MNIATTPAPARVNGQPLQAKGETLDAAALRQRACSELLRQAAQAAGLLDADDRCSTDGHMSDAASEAIERLLERELTVPEPDEAACRRYHAAHQARYATGERVRVRHILFAVTPGVDVRALRDRAEAALLEVRCHDGKDAPDDGDGGDTFARQAKALSNCPSGEHGGELGWLEAADCAPEFARELFGQAEVGVLPRLVHSRFGLHVVDVQQRERGTAQPYEAVRAAVQLALRQQSWVTALRQYLQLLAGQARLEGVQLDGSETPLVQ